MGFPSRVRLLWLDTGSWWPSWGLAFGCSTNTEPRPESDDPLGPQSARTVFAALGNSHPFADYDDAEQEVGWRVLRSVGSEWEPVGGVGGIIETFPEVGLPRVRKTYAIKSKGIGTTILVQEPEPYVPAGTPTVKDVNVGPWQGQWISYGSVFGFVFLTGESAQGLPITASAFVDGDHYSEDELRTFIESLTFDE